MSKHSREILSGRGYVVLRKFFDPAPFLRLAERMVVDHVRAGGGTMSGGFRPDVLSCPPMQELMADPRLLRIGRDVLGVKPAFGSLGINSVPHGSDGMDPHIDYPYFAMGKSIPRSGDPPLCLQIIWYLVDVTKDSAPTYVVPGTQVKPGRPSKTVFAATAKPVLAKAGSVFVGHGALWHGVGRNTSGRLRHALLGSYVPYWVNPMFTSYVPAGSEALRRLFRADLGERIGEGYLETVGGGKRG